MAGNKRHVAVVLAGGAGTRLWPLSRADRPKPFLPLIGGDDLFCLTLARLAQAAPIAGIDELIVVAARRHRDLVAARMAMAHPLEWRIVLEPAPRNTAPAIAAAVAFASRRHRDPILSVFPSDHFVEDWQRFAADLRVAVDAARAGAIVCFGVAPTSPNTAYGYIETDASVADVSPIVRFTEKPDLATAERWVTEKRHLWNSGMFVFGAYAMAGEFERQAPDIFAGASAAVAIGETDGKALVLGEAFGAARNISIDYAILENAANRQVVRAGFGWSDLGAWDQVAEIAARLPGGGAHVAIDSDGVHVAGSDRLVVTLGVRRLLVADTADVLLVADLARSQEVARALREAAAIDSSYGERTDSILALGKLARANRAFARSYVDARPAAAPGGFGEAPVVGALAEAFSAAGLLAFIEQLPDAGNADGAARQFLHRHYVAEDWRLSKNAVAVDEGETRAHYAWAKALARRFASRGHPMAEIARRLAIRAETSAIGPDGQTIRREFASDSPADARAATAAVRIEALARLAGLGFSEFRRPLEDAVALLRARLGDLPWSRQLEPDDGIYVAGFGAYLDLDDFATER